MTYLFIACLYYVSMGVGPFMLLADEETATAQTTLEQYNNNYMKSVCDSKGDTFHNMYDFGAARNLQDFFNIGPRGRYPWFTALLPLRIPPVGTGKKFDKSGRGFVLACNDDDIV
ncbi:hypothetical protein CPC16_006491 [Podila verticillata]|nr:hypothetical protein CPC16_006491 [Podila verticillata]